MGIPGGMAEWSKAAVLKTVVPKGTVGSNPTPSAKKFNVIKFHYKLIVFCFGRIGEVAELAEGARLLSECAVKAAPWVRIPSSPPIL
jgi:hypothetical protein